MYNFNPSDFQNLKFEFYPKTSLTIQLHRTQNDVFDYFSVEHLFIPELNYVDYILVDSKNAKDDIRVVPTSSDLYTKIKWSKKTNGQGVEKVDSIFCTKAGPNRYDIYY